MLDLVRHRGWYYLLSFLVILPGLISLLIAPALRPGIEFSSGTTMTLRFAQPVGQEDLRAALGELGHPETRVQRSGDDFLIRTRELKGAEAAPPVGPAPAGEREALEAGLRDRFGDFQALDFSSVSATVSREIGRNATIAVLAASLGILVYITWAFRRLPRPLVYGTGALIAMGHDILVVLGAYSIMGKLLGAEVNTMFIVGMLTIIGYSVHDTIVVFDRIRENRLRYSAHELEHVVNISLWETMTRSINTSMSVVIAIVALLLLGGPTIRDFLLVLLIGVVSGTYSSIFTASQFVVSWEKGDLRRLGRLLPRPLPAR